MNYPPAPDHMYQHRSSIIKNFGYDKKTKIDYQFNSLGYRANNEFITGTSPIVILGNTISFGLCLDVTNTFASILEQYFKKKVYNFSWGCLEHTNNQQLELLKSIIKVEEPSLVIFQINNLNRINYNGKISVDNDEKVVIAEFNNFHHEITKLLQFRKHIFLYWDKENYNVNLPNCLIKNRFLVDGKFDKSTIGGVKSHKLIGLKIIKEITEKKLLC